MNLSGNQIWIILETHGNFKDVDSWAPILENSIQ